MSADSVTDRVPLRQTFPWRRIIVLFVVATIASGTVFWFVVIPHGWLGLDPLASPGEKLFDSIALGVIAGFVITGGWTFELLVTAMARVQLEAAELMEGETVVRWSSGTHQPRRTIHAIGGKLFLTNRRLVFKTHAGQGHGYRLSIPLASIFAAGVYPLDTLGLYGLRVERTDHSFEVFNLGIQVNVEVWADAITTARDALGPAA